MSLLYKGTAKFQFAVWKLLRRWNTVNFVEACLVARILKKHWPCKNNFGKNKGKHYFSPFIIRCNLITILITISISYVRSHFLLRSLYSLKSIICSKNMILIEPESELAGANSYRSIYTPMERFCNLIRCHGYLTRQLFSSFLVSRSFRHS